MKSVRLSNLKAFQLDDEGLWLTKPHHRQHPKRLYIDTK